MSPRSVVVFALAGILLPALLAGVVLLAGRKLRGRPEVGWLGALAFGLAYLVGHAVVLGLLPPWPPRNSNQALFHGAILTTLGAALAASPRRSVLVASSMLGAAHVGAMALVVGGLVSREPFPRPVIFAAAGFALAAMVTMRFERVAAASPGPWTPLWLWIVAASSSIAHLLSGSLVYAQFAAVVSGILAAAVVVGALARDTSFARGLATAAYLQVLGVCVAGKLLSNLPTASFALLAGAPWLAALLVRGREARWSERKLRLAFGITIAISCAAAVALAYAEHRERSSAPY